MLLRREGRALGMLVRAVRCSLSEGTVVFNYLCLPQCLPSTGTLWWEVLGGHWVHTDLANCLCFHCTHPHLDPSSLSLWWINVEVLLVNILGAVVTLMLLQG